jgi:single-strand DNA-binding protein
MTGATVTISGNLTADPELRYTQNGLPVASFTVAHTERRFNRQTNEWEDFGDTLFLRCSAWRELGENIAASLTKGAAVMMIGTLVSRSYETDAGEKRTVTECRAEVVAVDLRRQTVASVMRIRKGGQPQEPVPDVWTPAALDASMSTAAA